MADECPVCKSILTAIYGTIDSDTVIFDCPPCGDFRLSGSAFATLGHELAKELSRPTQMSHSIRRMARLNKKPPVIGTNDFERIWSQPVLNPDEQADELILYLGDHQISHHEPQRTALYFLGAWVGTSILNPRAPHEGINWLLAYLADEKLLVARSLEEEAGGLFKTGMHIGLTIPGWRKYAELKQKKIHSRTAFMAMKFGDGPLNSVVETCFKPAVARTGFELRLLYDQQQAGLIDNQIRAAILSGKFVVADLSHHNNGAYWEAGFAEGAGLHVFYTCNEMIWKESKTHFDTNHMVTILWNPNNLKKAEDELAATIRFTLRDDANLADD